MEELNKNNQALKTKTQVRVGFVFVAILAAASMVLGAVQISRTIKAPFLPKDKGALSRAPTEEERKEELKKLDTDKDGLSDYEETYIYNTSPFIEDSDSDGAPDKAEVASGEDPNCPKGRNCFAPQVATSTPQSREETPALAPNLLDILGSQLNKNASSLDLRKQLEQMGVPKAVLDRLPDAELQKLYQETLREVLTTSTNR